MLFFNHQLIWKHFCLNVHFIYNYFIKKYWLHIQKKRVLNTCEIIDSSLLNNPLLSWDGLLNKKISRQNVIYIYTQNTQNNPWYKKYIIIFEQSNDLIACVFYHQTLLMKLLKEKKF